MSNEKQQIEEMAKVYDEARLKARDTLGSMNEGEGMWYSKAFYNAGYRKQSEGEWIDEDDIWYRAEMLHYRCSICGNHDYLKENFCSKCGAKMKGGAE